MGQKGTGQVREDRAPLVIISKTEISEWVTPVNDIYFSILYIIKQTQNQIHKRQPEKNSNDKKRRNRSEDNMDS